MRQLLVEELNPEYRRELQAGLRAANDQRHPLFAESRAPERQTRPLDLFVLDDDGQVAGGVVCNSSWWWTGRGVLEIDAVWLDEPLRGRGLGRELLGRVEREARARGCALAHLTTYHFQARGFYEKSGYRVVGRLDGYPPDGAMYWMAKELA